MSGWGRFAAEEGGEEESDSGKGGKPKLPARWQEFVDSVFEGGKKKVRNPQQQQRGQPYQKQVSFSTAMKDKGFQKSVWKRYNRWESLNKKKASSNLVNDVIRLAHAKPELREYLLPIIEKEAAGYSIDSDGLRKVGPGIFLQEKTPYYLGASSSPNLVFVTKVTNDVISYADVYDSPLRVKRIERWMGSDLITKGTQTWVSRRGKHFPKEAAGYKKLLAGKPAPEMKGKLSDYEKIFVVVRGTKEGDLWRQAEMHGNVGGFNEDIFEGQGWDSRFEHYEITMRKGELPGLKKDRNFKILEVSDSRKF